MKAIKEFRRNVLGACEVLRGDDNKSYISALSAMGIELLGRARLELPDEFANDFLEETLRLLRDGAECEKS